MQHAADSADGKPYVDARGVFVPLSTPSATAPTKEACQGALWELARKHGLAYTQTFLQTFGVTTLEEIQPQQYGLFLDTASKALAG
jgi:hypothetical protein